MIERKDIRLARRSQTPPGSPAAIALGCTCDPVKNRGGRGHDEDGQDVFYPNQVCPLHGIREAEKAVEMGDAEIVEVNESASNPRYKGSGCER